jgi:NADPH-dependent glutamate synthase beta subunit-like oxidoreductase/coenzyme F420-reducing hydrogenase delta subunit/Pyruvate/2-oxoacid:ferredoxin oxidoreductase delta subunit
MAAPSEKITVRLPREEGAWELTPLETSPCTLACPTRINARGYVSLVADGRFAEALALIRKRNPFPGVCGRICPRPCEAACSRAAYDDAIAICALKRFVFDVEMKRGIGVAVPARIHRTEKVAIIGAGPAGLSAAGELARFGYPVTVFEARSEPGGLMNLIPQFRLPHRVVVRETRSILDMGIEFVTGVRFGKDVTWNQLRRRGYKALVLCTGAWKPAWKWGVPGTKGVVHALDFLEHAALEAEDARVVVAGDTMMALDCARTAVRLGARSVTFVLSRSRALAPLQRDDLSQAEREGVKVLFLVRPSALVTTGGKLSGVKFVRLREGVPDATGRREVREISGSGFTGAFDIFIDAYTRAVDVRGLGSKLGLSSSRGGALAVDPGTSGAGAKGIFAAGDLVTGPRSVVEAVASGQRAAYGIHEYLSGERVRSPLDLTVDETIAHREYALGRVPEKAQSREAMPLENARVRRGDFREVERGYSARDARREAERCLRCGPCAECALCVDICEKKDVLLRVSEELVVDVHAGREFWSRMSDRVEIELEGERVEATPIRTICVVDERRCVGCGRCEDVCGYKAARVEAGPGGAFTARVDELACKGCGNCVAVCPTAAIVQRNFEHASIISKLVSIVPGRTKVLFVCHWATPAAVDLPKNVLLIETMCTGRVSASLIIDAVLRGAAAVMMCGCREDECHYGFGRRLSAKALEQCRGLLELFGYDSGMLGEEQCSRDGFAAVVRKWAGRAR